VEEAVGHLRTEHDVDMPDTETILDGELSEDSLEANLDPAVVMLVTRLREALNIVPPEMPTGADPAVARVTSR
jgi:hypothetical protein